METRVGVEKMLEYFYNFLSIVNFYYSFQHKSSGTVKSGKMYFKSASRNNISVLLFFWHSWCYLEIYDIDYLLSFFSFRLIFIFGNWFQLLIIYYQWRENQVGRKCCKKVKYFAIAGFPLHHDISSTGNISGRIWNKSVVSVWINQRVI